MGRVLVGAIVGGLVFFFWGYVAHDVLQLTEKTMKRVPDEAGLKSSMKDVKEPGLYLIPYMDPADHHDQAKKDAWMEKAVAGPSGMLVRWPDGKPFSQMQMMGCQLAASVIAAFIASLVVAAMGRQNAVNKVILVSLLGVFVWMNSGGPYWIWYRFPKDFAMAELLNMFLGWFLAGIAIAVIVRPKKVAAAPK
jgi:hypothetical protein